MVNKFKMELIYSISVITFLCKKNYHASQLKEYIKTQLSGTLKFYCIYAKI